MGLDIYLEATAGEAMAFASGRLQGLGFNGCMQEHGKTKN